MVSSNRSPYPFTPVLHAVGLTAAVASCLAEQGISANVLAAYYHDHVFVPHDQAEDAMHALQLLSQ